MPIFVNKGHLLKKHHVLKNPSQMSYRLEIFTIHSTYVKNFITKIFPAEAWREILSYKQWIFSSPNPGSCNQDQRWWYSIISNYVWSGTIILTKLHTKISWKRHTITIFSYSLLLSRFMQQLSTCFLSHENLSRLKKSTFDHCASNFTKFDNLNSLSLN